MRAEVIGHAIARNVMNIIMSILVATADYARIVARDMLINGQKD